jgi:hypothetical protein
VGSLLGGHASPIGWTVQYLEAPRDVVVAEIVRARAEWGHVIEVASPRPFPEVLHDLLPFEAPWTRELVVSCGRWTAYLNNGVDGGDATAIGGALVKRLGVRRDQSGVPFGFEHTERYGTRRVREPFGRTLLVEYLEQFGISADDDTFYGDGILVQQRVTYATRTESLEQAKARIAGGGR